MVHQHIGLKQVLSENQPVAVKCPECETEFGQLDVICPHCGYDLRGKWNINAGHEAQRVTLPILEKFKIRPPDIGKVCATLIGIPVVIGLVWLLVWFVHHVLRG